jgi:hypothetical protein
MRDWVILGFVIVALIAVSGCSPTKLSCVNDGFCSLDEKYLGTCGDCKPDFVVESQNLYAYYNPSTGLIDASVCVKNTNGEYEGDVSVGWYVCTSRDCQSAYETQKAYFSAPSVESHAYLTVKKGQVFFDSQFLSNREQYSCFSKQFTVNPSSDYWVNFNINGDQRVDELKFDNDWGQFYVKGVAEHYPDILLEYNLGAKGEYAYQDSHQQTVSESAGDTVYNINVYNANYLVATAEVSSSSQAAIGYFESVALAKSYLDRQMSLSSGRFSVIKLSNGVDVFAGSDGTYAWQSDDKIVVVSDFFWTGQPAESNPLALAYSDKYFPTGTPLPTPCVGSGMTEIELRINGKTAITDLLKGGDVRTYTVGGRDYEVTVLAINPGNVPTASFMVNGVKTPHDLSAGKSEAMSREFTLYVKEILTTTGSGEAKFYLKRPDSTAYAIQDTLAEGQTKTYTIDGKDYEVTGVFIAGPDVRAAKLSVNGVIANLREGTEQTLALTAPDSLAVGLTSVTVCKPVCGNRVIDVGETCDTDNFNNKNCASLGFDGGVLKCNKLCAFETDGCVTIGTPPVSNGTGGAGGSGGSVTPAVMP